MIKRSRYLIPNWLVLLLLIVYPVAVYISWRGPTGAQHASSHS